MNKQQAYEQERERRFDEIANDPNQLQDIIGLNDYQIAQKFIQFKGDAMTLGMAVYNLIATGIIEEASYQAQQWVDEKYD
jgi:hypothetical protein